METVTSILPSLQSVLYATPAVVCGLVIFAFIFKHFVSNQKRASSNLPPVPEVPGWPVIGNLLQLNEKKPHMTFAKWAETYGPIYSIKTGAYTVVVLNSTELAKEAMVTRFSSISTRKLSKAWSILTQDKCMVATSDYNEYHKMVKRYARASVFGPNAQRRHRGHRDTLVENITSQLRAHLNTNPKQPVNFREIFKFELFGLAMKEALGEDVESVYSDELGISLSREELFTILVLDPLEGSIEVDWREFFPYLRWIPNQSFDGKLGRIHFRKHAVLTALIEEKKKRIASGQETDCYLDFLLSEGKTLTEVQIETLIWETIIGASETTMVTVEWAMYELAKNTVCQDKLYHEIKNVCGSKKMEEEHLPQLPYLNAVFHETLRKYSPAPLVPLRFVREDTELGGYHVPAGTEIAINIYGCNMDKKQWENPEDWKPERFLDGNYDPMDFLKTMAFGAGKRTCAGVLQATLIGCTSIGRQMQEFEWRLNDEVEENVNTLAFTSRKLHPFYAMIKRRSQ